MVNAVNVNRVADAIEAGELVKRGIGFNMGLWKGPARSPLGDFDDKSGHGCQTIACIGGWATIILRIDGSEQSVTSALGMHEDEANELFYDFEERSGCPFRDITPAHAVAVLRHLAKTGEVDWSIQPPSNTGSAG